MSDLSELFARDPLGYSKQDIATIIEEMRKKRGQFNLGNMKAGSTKPLTEKQKAIMSVSKDLLGGLDL